MIEIKTVEIGTEDKPRQEFELYLDGSHFATSKLHCDAVLAKRGLETAFAKHYGKGYADGYFSGLEKQ